MSNCLFCKIISQEIPADFIYEDELVVVIKDKFPKADVHLLVLPREHIETLNDLTEKHDKLIAHIMRLLPRLAKEQGLHDGTGAGFRTIINTGRGGGQEIFHLHVHLLGGRNLPGFK
jgi:histidine triad (HIT) family protein